MPSGLIVCDGNSLTTGNGGQSTPWPTTAAATLNFGAGLTWQNIAVGGRVTPTMLANAAANVDALYGTVAGPTNIVVAWELSNDIANGGAPPVHAFERMRRYCGERRSKGWKVIVATMMARGAGNVYSGETLEGLRQTVNTLVRNTWSDYADALVDIGEDAVFGVDGGWTNATFFQPDLIHFTEAGGARAAALFQTAIARLAI